MGFTFCKLEAEAIRQHTGAAGSFFTLKRYKKRHIPKKCPFLRLPQRNKSTLDRNVPCYLHGHTDSKNGFIYVFFEVVVQEWTFTISLPNFLFSDLYFCLYLYCLPEMQHALR